MREKHISRTSAGLRNVLFEEIDKIRNGESEPTRALAIATLAGRIISIATLEYKIAKDDSTPVPSPINLGDMPNDEAPGESFIKPPDKQKLMAGR